MSVLAKINLKEAETSQNVAFIKLLIAREFWKWYEEHQNDKIVKLKILFISKTVRVKDIKFVFELLFGVI